MRFKHVPPAPPSLDTVTAARRAIPLVPDPEADCCARLLDRLDLPSRDVARTWLTFLRALGLVERTDSGFRRTDADADPERLRSALLDRAFPAAETLAALRAADGPLAADEVFGRVRERVPRWERHRNPRRWEDVWRERVERLLGWLVLLDLAAREDGGYVARPEE